MGNGRYTASLQLTINNRRNLISSMHITRWLDQKRDIGVLLLRLFIGVRLIYGVTDNVFSWQHMLRFRDFLQAFNFPFPLVAAILSVYIQLVAGLMIIIGWNIRFASLLLIVNFTIALIMVHR